MNTLPTGISLTSIETVNIETAGDLGQVAVAGQNAVPAEKQVDTITFDAFNDDTGATATYNVTWDGVTVTTAARDNTATAAESAVLVKDAINAIAGSNVAAVVGSQVVITAPVAGTQLPTYSVTSSDSADTINGVVQSSGGFVTDTANANVEAQDAVTAVAAAAYDLSGQAVDDINVTGATSANVKAGAETNLSVSGVTGDITLDGAQNVVVNDDNANNDITIGANTVNNGTISVTDTDQGTGNIAVDGGTDVNVNATSEDTGAIKVGATEQASGAVSVTQNLENDGTGGGLTGGAITTTGGSTVDVTVNANSVAEEATSDADTTVGTVSVTGDDSTTDVTVTQNDNSETFTKEAEGQKTETASIKFGVLKSGDALKVAGLTFTAAKDLTAEEVAQAFSELTKDDTQDAGGSVENGVYTDALSGWTSAEANGDTVVFTSTSENTNATDIDDTSGVDLTNTSGNSVAPVVTTTDGDAGTAEDVSKNAVDFGKVTVADAGVDSIKNVTLDGYATASTIAADALETLNIANSAAGADLEVSTAATALTVNADGVTSGSGDNAVVNLDSDGSGDFNNQNAATVTDLTLNASGADSAFILEAAAAKNLTVNADAKLNIGNSDSTFASTDLETVDVNGAAAVALGDISGATGLNSFDASGNTGGVTATIATTDATLTGDIAEYVCSEGNDDVTLDETDVNVDINLGGGDDTVTLADGTTAVASTIDGGAGTNRVAAKSGVLSGNESTIAAGLTNFQQLEISEQVDLGATTGNGSVAIDLAELGFDYVVTNGTTTAATTSDGSFADALELNNMANNGTVVLEGAQKNTDTNGTDLGSINVDVTDAATGTDDVLNLVVSGDDTIDAGTVTANDVETLNIQAEDVFVDSSTPKDGKDNNDANHTLTASGDSVESIVVTGDDLTLTTDSAVLTSVDASAMTGGITYTADAADEATTVLGGQGADNLTAAGSQDVLNGGAGNDTLTGADLTQLTGGEGADTFVMNTPTNANSYATITDLEAGDVIDLSNVTSTGQAFSSSAVTLADTAVFQDYANASVNQLAADNEDFAWFQFGGNTFIVGNDDQSDGANDNFENGTDSIIQITGLVDLSTASYNQTDGTLEIA